MTTLVLTRINENYLTDHKATFCGNCGDRYVKHYCETHFTEMGCYFCDFDYTEKCDEQH